MQEPNFNDLIHQERTRLLAILPKGADVFCSAGCSGSWYFRWVEDSYGPIKKHIGIELYSPKPDDLPANVEWIQNSVSDMVDIASSSVDMLFSGQNIEHLYPDDLRGFFSEANRVIKPGGTLCIDSPNRSVTQPGRYVQQEHVLELSVGEAVRLTSLAGFTVSAVHGIWLCEDDSFKKLEVFDLQNPVKLQERLSSAKFRPNNSFIWWIVATKTGEPSATLGAEIDSLFLKDFPGFVRSRFSLGCGAFKNACGTEAIVQVSKESNGCVFYGPYVPLAPGNYVAEFLIKMRNPGGKLVFDVVSNLGASVHSTMDIHADGSSEWQSICLSFSLDKYITGVETRVFSENVDAVLRFGSQIVNCD